MPSIVSITLKNEEKKQTNRHLIYEDYMAKIDDPLIGGLLNDALKEFNAEPDSVKIKISIEV